jgi:hypothetical protein
MVLAMAVLSFGRIADAQQTESLNVNDVVELLQTDVSTHRKSVIAKSMELTEKESKVFWPVYREYHADLAELNDRTVKLIEAFLKDRENLSDEVAKKLLDEYLDIEKGKLKLKNKYVKKFKKKLPPRRVLKYFQLENKLDAALNWGFADEIPLAK